MNLIRSNRSAAHRSGTKLSHWLVAALALAVPAAPALAQSFPDRPVTIVVPFPPGGSVDGVARALASTLSQQTGKAFVVDNRAGGAGGVVGSADVVKSAPDGYTLVLDASIHVVTPLINKNVPYDVIGDFTPLGEVAEGPLLVSTNPKVKADTLKAFFDEVKAKPDDFSFATSGYGSAGHLAVEMLKQKAGVDVDVIAYKGGGPALNDMIGGQVQLIADPMMSSLPYVKGGRLKALAVTSKTRSPLAPDVPTVDEAGMGPFEMVSWYGVWAPKNLDPAAATYLEKAIAETVKSDEFKQKLTTFGFEPKYRNAQELRAFEKSEIERYDAIVKAAKISVE